MKAIWFVELIVETSRCYQRHSSWSVDSSVSIDNPITLLELCLIGFWTVKLVCPVSGGLLWQLPWAVLLALRLDLRHAICRVI